MAFRLEERPLRKHTNIGMEAYVLQFIYFYRTSKTCISHKRELELFIDHDQVREYTRETFGSSIKENILRRAREESKIYVSFQDSSAHIESLRFLASLLLLNLALTFIIFANY